MPLPTNLKDQVDTLYDISNEPQTIAQSNNDGWGYGFFLDHVPHSSVTPTGTIAGNAFTVVTTAPSAGQIRVHYTTEYKFGWVECNSADTGKAVVITYKGQGQAWNSKRANEAYTQINTNATNIATNTSDISALDTRVTVNESDIADHESRIAVLEGGTGGSVEFKIKSVTPVYGAEFTSSGNIVINMTKEVDVTSLGNIILKDSLGSTVACTISLNISDAKQIIVNPNADLSTVNTPHTLEISPGLKAGDAEVLGYAVTWTFTSVVLAGNSAPTASNVSILGTPSTGKTLTGAYIYSDVDGDSEGATTFKWYNGTASNGSDKVAIEGATNQTYVLQASDETKYIFFEVTPVDSVGNVGTPVVSAGVQAVANSAPVWDVDPATKNLSISVDATNVTGTLLEVPTDADGDTLTYVLQVDTVNTFDSVNLVQSAGQTQVQAQAGVSVAHGQTGETTLYARFTANDGVNAVVVSEVVSGSAIVLAPTGTVTKYGALFETSDVNYNFIYNASISYDETEDKFYIIATARVLETDPLDRYIVKTCPGTSDPSNPANWSAWSVMFTRLGSSWETGNLGQCSLYRDTDGIWYLFYACITTGSPNVVKIGYATCPSDSDPTVENNWTRYGSNPILTPPISGWEYADNSIPCVYKDGLTWAIMFTGADSNNIAKVGIATGASLGSLTKSANNPIASPDTGENWRKSRLYNTAGRFVKVDNKYYHFVRGYNADTVSSGGYGLISSSSLDSGWTFETGNPKISVGTSGQPDSASVWEASWTYKGDKYYVFYRGSDGTTNRLCLASIPRY